MNMLGFLYFQIKTAFEKAGVSGRAAPARGQNTAHDFCLAGFTQLYPGCGITLTRNVFLVHTGMLVPPWRRQHSMPLIIP